MSGPEITLFLPSLEGGGAERVFVELANEFVARDLRVDLVLASAHGPYLAEVSPAVRVIDFGARDIWRSFVQLARYLRSEHPKVVLSGLSHANIVTILARFVSGRETRCVVSMRSVPTAVYGQIRTFKLWMILRLMRFTYPFADAIIANSNAVASDLSQLMHAPEIKQNVVYNPLNVREIQQLSLDTVEHAWCRVGAPPIILGVGSLTVLKDFPTLVRAFATVRASRDCRLVILGEGSDRVRIESLIRELGLQSDVHLPGFVGNPFAWMRIAKVFVNSSLTEGCPNALMQALACGTPVISADCVGGSAEILEQGRWGRLIAVGDSNGMAEAIVATLDATDYPDVQKRANDFAHVRIVQQYLDILLPDQSQFSREH